MFTVRSVICWYNETTSIRLAWGKSWAAQYRSPCKVWWGHPRQSPGSRRRSSRRRKHAENFRTSDVFRTSDIGGEDDVPAYAEHLQSKSDFRWVSDVRHIGRPTYDGCPTCGSSYWSARESSRRHVYPGGTIRRRMSDTFRTSDVTDVRTLSDVRNCLRAVVSGCGPCIRVLGPPSL